MILHVARASLPDALLCRWPRRAERCRGSRWHSHGLIGCIIDYALSCIYRQFLQEADPPAGCSSDASPAMERQAMPMFAPLGATAMKSPRLTRCTAGSTPEICVTCSFAITTSS